MPRFIDFSFKPNLLLKKISYCFLLFIGVSFQSKAQCPTIFIDDMNGVPGYAAIDDLSVCGAPDTISFYILNTSGQELLNSELKLSIPPGMQYAGFIDAFDTAYTVMEGDVSNLNCPTFIFPRISADSVQIVQIGIIANCDVYTNPSTQEYKFSGLFDFLYLESGAQKPILCSATYDGDIDYSAYIKKPTITITNQTRPTIRIVNANRVCNSIEVTQSGIKASVSGFTFTIDGIDLNNFNLNEISVGGTALNYTWDPATMRLTTFVDDSYLPGGALLEDESIDVLVCFDAPLICDTELGIKNLTYGAAFGCSPEDPPCVTPSYKSGSIEYKPNFNANADVTVTQVQDPGICGADAVFDAVVKSTNPDPVLGLWEEIKLGFQICEGDAFEPSDVLINGVSLDPSSYYYDNFDFVIDATTFTSDPDGPGVGFDDIDGDGFFDDLPGGQEAVMTIAVKVKCQDPAAIAGCSSLDCSFDQMTVTGLRHCGQAFQITPTISPAPVFSYGSSFISINETDISPNQDGSIAGFAFGQGTGTNDSNASLNTVNMEFCYQYDVTGIDPCSATGDSPYFEISVGGPRIVVSDMVINNSSVTFNGAPVAPSLIRSDFNIDTSGVVFGIDIGNNDTTVPQCYNFTLELDSCVCYPLQYLSASMRVIETCGDCAGPDGEECTFVRACEDTQLSSLRSCSCVCPMSSDIVEIRRVEYGYADKAMTQKLEYDSPEVDPLDWNRYLPCDTMFMHVEYTVIDPLTMADLDEIYFRIYNFATPGTHTHRPTFELEPDMHNSRMLEFSFEKVSSPGIRTAIDFNACNIDRAARYRNINDGYLDGIGAEPLNLLNGVSTYNSAGDVFDNREFQIRIDDADRQKERGANVNTDGDCWTDLLENQMGGLEKGDKFHIVVHIPMQKNPYRLLIPDIEATPPATINFRGDAFWYTVVGGVRSYTRSTCTSNRIIETHCPGPIESATEYTVTDCGATVEHSFLMTNTPADWYVGEFRPDIMEMDTLKIPLPSPFVYAGNPRVELPDGTIIPLSDPVFDSNTFCAFDASANQTKCTSLSGSVGFMMFDVSELPTFGVGLANDPACSYKLLYDLERICPGPINSPEDFQLLYDYSYTCDYESGGHYCNYTLWTAPPFTTNRPDYSFIGTQTAYPVEDCPGDVSTSGLIFDTKDYHLTQDTSFTLTFNDTSNPLPPLSSTITNNLLADAGDMSEFNTYEVCAGAGVIPHTNVMTTVFLEPTVSLQGITDVMGNPVAYTLTNTSGLGSTYLLALPDLNPGDCSTLIIETELEICPFPGIGTLVTVKTTSSCMDLEFASQLFGIGGEACVATGQQYNYMAEEAEIQSEWTTGRDTVPLCSTNEYGVLIKNTKDATLVDLEFNFNFPPGLIIIPNSFEYEYVAGSGNWLPISDPVPSYINAFGQVYTITDDDMTSDINLNGLPGILDPVPNANRLQIRFKAKTDCDAYVSRTPFYFESTASDPCEGRVTSGTTIFEGTTIENAIPEESAQFLMTADPLDYICGGPVPMTVSGVNLSTTGGETLNSEACFTFPPELTYTPSSFVFTAPASWTPTYVNETILPGGYVQLCFDLPDGLKPYESFAFAAEVSPDSTAQCKELLIGSLVKTIIENQICVGDDNVAGTPDDSNCDVFVNNSINDQLVVNIKAPVRIGDLEMILVCDDDPTRATFDYSITLETVSSTDYVGAMTLEFYRDLNLNGVFDPGIDPLMDTQNHTINVISGSPTIEMGSTTVPQEFSCPIIINAIFDVACNCSSESFYFDSPPIPDFIAEFNGPINLCPGDDLTLAICAGYDFELANPASGVITESGNTLTLMVNDGYGVLSPVVLKVTSLGSCGGEFEVDIYTLESFEIGPFEPIMACDMECDALILEGIPAEWQGNMTVLWSPDTYLDDATAWEPEICNPTSDITYTVTVTNPNTGCTASAMVDVVVINTTAPTLSYDGFTDCYFAYDPPKIIAEPAGLVNYDFYFSDPAGDILLQTGPSNVFVPPFPAGDFYVIVDDGECLIPSAILTTDLEFCTFDMALKKVLSPTQVVPVHEGQTVVFDITVYNQGTEVAQDILVTDYIPAGFVLNDPNWTSVSATEANITIPGPLSPGASQSVSIILDVTNASLAGDIANYAEISSADDMGNQGYPDIDSTPDNDNTNDIGGTPNDPNEDDVISDDGTIDEDDHDPATVPVVLCETLGGVVFIDADEDGCQASPADGFAGLTVDLYVCDASGMFTQLSSTTTSADGSYAFGLYEGPDNLCLDPNLEYRTQISAPSGYSFTTGAAASCPADEDDSPGNDGISDCYNPSDSDVGADSDEHIDFGIVCDAVKTDAIAEGSHTVCIAAGETGIRNIVTDDTEILPPGYQILYILIDSTGTIVTTNPESFYNVNGPGSYVAYSVAYNPADYDVALATSLADINENMLCGDISEPLALEIDECCTAFAGISIDETVSGCVGENQEATLTWTNSLSNLPPGYVIQYILADGTNGLIFEISSTPTFNVSVADYYAVHQIVYHPSEFDLSPYVEYVNYVHQINGALFTSDLCADLDLVGGHFLVQECCTAFAGLTVDESVSGCVGQDQEATLLWTTSSSNLPPGYVIEYILTDGANGIILDISSSPNFVVSTPDYYSVHQVVYHPSQFDLSLYTFGIDNVNDINSDLNASDLCADLDIIGGDFVVEECCTAFAGLSVEETVSGCAGGGQTSTLTWTTTSSNLPPGYVMEYILSDGANGLIVDFSSMPSFIVSTPNYYSVHQVVFHPSEFSLNQFTSGVHYVNDINTAVRTANLCADVDIVGGDFVVPDCCSEDLYIQGIGISVPGGHYERDGIISSDGLIDNSPTDFDSGTAIEMLPGFEVILGVEFHAYIDGCN